MLHLFQCRGWGAEIDPDYHRKQKDLWDQVSRRSSLSALSLAAIAVRPATATKEQKEKEKLRHHLERTTGSGEAMGMIYFYGVFTQFAAFQCWRMALCCPHQPLIN